MKVYAGMDLHSNNTFLGIINEAGKRVFKARLVNEPDTILSALAPFRRDLASVAVESTFNWYWLVDLLMEKGYDVRLANPAAIQKYSGLKHSSDVHDAFWLAEMLRFGILPQGYIYPRERRPVRDLLRKRSHLVRLRTSLVLSLQNILARNGREARTRDILRLSDDRIAPLLEDQEDLALAGLVSKESIDFLTRRIKRIEKTAEERVELESGYRSLLSIPGVGRILGLTIMLETGPLSRFAGPGNYVSYCRHVPSRWSSNGKPKGKGNKKNGNKYLSWAFSEAAMMARRHSPEARRWYDRKRSRSGPLCAQGALAAKLARAAYCVMKDNTAFAPEKCFA